MDRTVVRHAALRLGSGRGIDELGDRVVDSSFVVPRPKARG